MSTLCLLFVSSILQVAVHIVIGVHCYEHIMSALRDTLLWQSVWQHIAYKLQHWHFDVFVVCAANFADVCTPVQILLYEPGYDHDHLIIPIYQSKCIHKSLSWNSLPRTTLPSLVTLVKDLKLCCSWEALLRI